MRSPHRQPRYLVYLWDILTSGAPAIASIVASTADTAFRLDVTSSVHGGVTIEESGDQRAAQVQFTLSDILGKFDPVSGTHATYMQRNQVAHVKIGDATISAGDYVGVFFGHIRGQVGFTLNRESLQRETSITCYNRRATPQYLKRRFISPSFTNAVDFGTIIEHVTRVEMDMTQSETRVPALIGQLTQFSTNTIADLTPLEAIDKILEAVGHVSDFDGDGKLRSYSRDVRRAPDTIYANTALVVSLDYPSSDTETYNSVKVIGLDKNITLLEQPEQALARATIPVGFFRPRHRVRVPWSQDNSLRAINTTMVIEVSVNDSLMIDIGSEDYVEDSEYDGHITVSLSFFLHTFALILAVALILSHAIPDLSSPTGGPTTPVGRLIEGVLIQLLTFCISMQSSGTYEIRGTPLLPVYKEISAVLTISGTPDYLMNQREIHNDWINDQEHLLAVCLIELLFEAAQSSPRSITMVDDYALEVGDIIQIPFGTEVLRLWIESLRRTLSGGDSAPLLEISGYKVPEGV